MHVLKTALIFCLLTFRARLRAGIPVCLMLCWVPIFAQTSQQAENTSPPAIVTGEPFSAVKFTHVVHIQKDGTPLVTAEKGHALLARDLKGRIFMSGAAGFNDDCDLPELGKLPVCDAWRLFIFDPGAGVMWHWGDGELATKLRR